MLYESAITAANGWVCRLVSCLLICGSTLTSFAQYETYDPEPTYDGQIISIHFYLSQAGTNHWYDSEIELVHSYAGFDIDSTSTISIDTDGSGYGQGTTLESSYSIDHSKNEITVTLRRVDGDSVYTGGWGCSLHGVGVLLEDVHVRQANPSAVVESEELLLYPNPVLNILTLEQYEAKNWEFAYLQDLSGNIVLNLGVISRDSTIRWDLSVLPVGLYWLCLKRKDEIIRLKLVKS